MLTQPSLASTAGCTPEEALQRIARLGAERADNGDRSFEPLAALLRQAAKSPGQETDADVDVDGVVETKGGDGTSGTYGGGEDMLEKGDDAPGETAHRFARELKHYLGRLIGSRLLAPEAEKLATTFIGNWAVIGAVRALREDRHLSLDDPRLASLPGDLGMLEAKIFAGVKVRGQPAPKVALGRRDGPAEVLQAWEATWARLASGDAALILHHKNHYALIFAMRVWDDDEGTRHRELLSARKGQRPSAWLDWGGLHSTLARWAGYGIIEVSETANVR